MDNGGETTGLAFSRPVSVVTFGAVKVVVIVCATVLAMGGKLDSAGVTAIYSAVIAAGPIETAASGVAVTRTRKAEAEVITASDGNAGGSIAK